MERDPEGLKFHKLWSRKLEYGGLFDWEGRSLLPGVFIAPESGATVMFWSHRGQTIKNRQVVSDVKNAVVIYTGEGKLLKKYKLTDLFPPDFIRQNFVPTISFVWWLAGTDFYYSKDARSFAIRLRMEKTWRDDPEAEAVRLVVRDTPNDKVLVFILRNGNYVLGDADLLTADIVRLDPSRPGLVWLGSDTVTDRIKHASGGKVRLARPPWAKE